MDGISILSNSNVAEAQSIAAVKKAEHYLALSPVVIASSLEALNGNVSRSFGILLKPKAGLRDMKPLKQFLQT